MVELSICGLAFWIVPAVEYLRIGRITGATLLVGVIGFLNMTIAVIYS